MWQTRRSGENMMITKRREEEDRRFTMEVRFKRGTYRL